MGREGGREGGRRDIFKGLIGMVREGGRDIFKGLIGMVREGGREGYIQRPNWYGEGRRDIFKTEFNGGCYRQVSLFHTFSGQPIHLYIQIVR